MSQIDLIKYKELLAKLEQSNGENHLLLGNGFNNSLGIKTNYSEIFSRMKQEYSGYKKIEDYLVEEDYDVEALIEHLKQSIYEEYKFLDGYIETKVKIDFMKAANEIVQDSIKDVYQDKNSGIYLLLRNFTNYFTLNYDPFLYLLLLKFKNKEEGLFLGLQNSPPLIEEDLNSRQKQIYSKIDNARKNGVLKTEIGKEQEKSNFRTLTKTTFTALISTHFKEEEWKQKEITKVCDIIWQKENNTPVLDVNDGFFAEKFLPHSTQNLYFLHGAFHIRKKGLLIEKIASTQNKTFCQKLEKAIHSKEQEIICVLTNSSTNKLKDIKENIYLSKCYDYLSTITGSLVILGSSLAKNDSHIFNQIVKSHINDIYISSCEAKKERDFKKATKIFKSKQVYLFDHQTISYDENNE